MSECRVWQCCFPVALQNTPDYKELLEQINMDDLSKLFDCDWSDPEGWRKERNSRNSELENTKEHDQTAMC